MSARKVLLILSGALAACLLICVVVVFLAVRGVRTGIEQSVERGIAAVVEEEIGQIGAAAPGDYTIDVTQILDQIDSQLRDQGANIDDLVVRIEPGNQFEIGFDSEGQSVTYQGRLEVVDGELRVTGMKASSGWLDFLVPGSRVASGIETGVNDYLRENNLVLTDVTTESGAVTLTVAYGSTRST